MSLDCLFGLCLMFLEVKTYIYCTVYLCALCVLFQHDSLYVSLCALIFLTGNYLNNLQIPPLIGDFTVSYPCHAHQANLPRQILF
uniref:Uncharacterized protein n=1 Tax=Pseudonaja textilis TaxID=8673 RepID=A0A670XY18_PSETE